MKKRPPPLAGLSANEEARRLRTEEKVAAREVRPRALIATVLMGVLGAAAGEFVFRRLFDIEGFFWVGLILGIMMAVQAFFMGPKRSDAWSKGAIGEEKTEKWLRRLGPQFRVLHDLAIPGSKANIDHLVIGPTGVFVVDSKNYKWKITENARGELWSGRYPLARALSTLNWEAKKVAAHLGVEVTPILCIHGADPPQRNIVKEGVRLAGPRGLVRIINEGRSKVSTDRISELAARAESLGGRVRANVADGRE